VTDELVFFVDVDNTLLDNDRLKEDLGDRIEEMAGTKRERLFWRVYEDVRDEEGYVDYPGTVKRFGEVTGDRDLEKRLADMMFSWPFRKYLYPGALETIAHLRTLGRVVILSDGDTVYQPLKIRESGLEAAVDRAVVISVHKEEQIGSVIRLYPAHHYVIIDDKPRILAVLARECTADFTTVLVRQGSYASHACDYEPRPDIIVDRIGDLRTFTAEQFLRPQQTAGATH